MLEKVMWKIENHQTIEFKGIQNPFKNPSPNLSKNECQKGNKKEVQKEGRRQRRHPLYPPPPACRGTSVHDHAPEFIQDSYNARKNFNGHRPTRRPSQKLLPKSPLLA